MADDKVTVLETFVLSCLGVMSEHDLYNSTTTFSDDDYVRGHWEFIRRYMEDGPGSIAGQVQFCMPIDRCKERAINGFHRIMANFSGGSFILIAIMFPFCALIALFRALAMITSKIPQWPEEIEAVNVIDTDDPYAIRGDGDGNRIAVFPRAAHEAGVAFSEAATR